MSTVMADRFLQRNEILQEIADLEGKVEALKAQLPVVFKKMWLFRCQPERKVWIYAETQEEATKKLHARMTANYKDAWQVVSKVVQSFSPGEMAMQTPGNFLTCLTKADALEFLEHYNSNERGIDLPKDLPPDRVRRDVRDFEKWTKTDRR